MTFYSNIRNKVVVLIASIITAIFTMSMPVKSMLSYRNNSINEALPYDAKVEYIESTGFEYINTHVLFNDGIAFHIKLSINEFYADAMPLFGYRFIHYPPNIFGNMRFIFFSSS